MKQKRMHPIPLQTQAVIALRELKLITGHSAYLFPNMQTPSTHMSENTLNFAIQKGLGFECTAHGMRSTFSTIMNEKGYRHDVIEIALAHVDSTVRGIYNRADYMPERRQLMQAWADHLDQLRLGA
jgi:integrase